MIYLKHPIHGVKITNMELEAVFDERNGWTRYDPSKMNTSREGLTDILSVEYNKITPVAVPAAPSKKVK